MKLYEASKGKWLSSPSLWAPTQVAHGYCHILPLLIIMKQIQEKKEEIVDNIDLTQSYDNLSTQKRHQKLWLHNNFRQT